MADPVQYTMDFGISELADRLKRVVMSEKLGIFPAVDARGHDNITMI